MLKFLSLISATSIALISLLSKVSLSQPLVLMGAEYPEVESYTFLKCYIQTSNEHIFDLQQMCESSGKPSNYSGRVIDGYNFSIEPNTAGGSVGSTVSGGAGSFSGSVGSTVSGGAGSLGGSGGGGGSSGGGSFKLAQS